MFSEVASINSSVEYSVPKSNKPVIKGQTVAAMAAEDGKRRYQNVLNENVLSTTKISASTPIDAGGKSNTVPKTAFKGTGKTKDYSSATA